MSRSQGHAAFDEGYAVAGVVRRFRMDGLDRGDQRLRLRSDELDTLDGVFRGPSEARDPQPICRAAGLQWPRAARYETQGRVGLFSGPGSKKA